MQDDAREDKVRYRQEASKRAGCFEAEENNDRVDLHMSIHFVDFDKAFVSVHRESLWSIMRSCGIPCKMLRVIKDVCEGFEWAVVDRIETADWFKIKSGVKQGCVMLGFLFLLLALDWIMRKVTADMRRGIQWNFTTLLVDLDFADDTALVSSKFNCMRRLGD